MQSKEEGCCDCVTLEVQGSTFKCRFTVRFTSNESGCEALRDHGEDEQEYTSHRPCGELLGVNQSCTFLYISVLFTVYSS